LKEKSHTKFFFVSSKESGNETRIIYFLYIKSGSKFKIVEVLNG